jgi:type IV pilus assembly protein PilW
MISASFKEGNFPAAGRHAKGFTLVELMVAMGLALMVMVLIYTTYRAQTGSYRAQEGAVDMMQNARTAMFYMQHAIRMSGFDPRRSAAAGFVANFAAPYTSFGATTNSVSIAFTADDDEDGAIDPSSAEIIAFRLDSNRLQRLMIDSGSLTASWETLAENIDALNFVFLDESGAPMVLASPPSATQLANIRSVQVSLVVRADEEPAPPSKKKISGPLYRNQQGAVIFDAGGDNITRTLLSGQVLCRNLGL